MSRRKKSNPTQEALDLLKEIQELILLKEKCYGRTWYSYGIEGNMSHLAEKCLRFLHMKRYNMHYYYFEDTLKDIIVWATFIIVCLKDYPVPKPIKILSKKKLYGDMAELDQYDMFVLSSKFYNSLFTEYIKRKSLTKKTVDELIDSLERMKGKLK